MPTIVTTTIFVPTFLTKYAENIKRHGHKHVPIIVVGDKKSPSNTREFCNSIENCTYMGLSDQAAYMGEHGLIDLLAHHPFNSISRRNIGHLAAYEAGADSIIMLDDDNLATDQDVIGHHEVGDKQVLTSYGSSTGWFNVCSALKERHGVDFYARGYPPSQRWNDGLVTDEEECKTVAVNAGLWLNDPDIDALTRLERHLITTGTNPDFPYKFSLQPGTWSPWNCQNTAISRDALQSYFLSPYTGRHLDIWASYITTRIAEHLGEVIAFGTPLAFHDRTPHNLYDDLEQEIPWIRMTDNFVEVLRSITVEGSTYTEGLSSVIEGLRSKWKTTDEVKDLYLDGLTLWNEVFK